MGNKLQKKDNPSNKNKFKSPAKKKYEHGTNTNVNVDSKRVRGSTHNCNGDIPKQLYIEKTPENLPKSSSRNRCSPTTIADEDPSLQFKIYKSFNDLSKLTPSKRRTNVEPDIKIYRRSNNIPTNMSLLNLNHHHQNRSTIPTTMDNLGGTPYCRQNSRYQKSSGEDYTSLLRHRSTYLHSSTTSLHRSSLRKKTRSSLSINSIGYKVSAHDFPTVSTVKHKINHFERCFVKKMVDHFDELQLADQLELLTYGVSTAGNEKKFISLKNFVSSSEQQSSRRDVKPVISDEICNRLKLFRNERMESKRTVKECARQIFTGSLLAASKEISRIFEYQISLIPEGMSGDMLVLYLVECIVNHIRPSRGVLLHVNSIVHGAIWGTPRYPEKWENCKISVLIGEKELKWKLNEIFLKPGLRKDVLLFNERRNECLWKFSSHPRCDCLLYGYRGLVLETDFLNNLYRIHENDHSFCDEVESNPEDFHRNYVPYKRLTRPPRRPKNLPHSSNNPNAPNIRLEKVSELFDCKDDYELVYRELQQVDITRELHIMGLVTPDHIDNTDDDNVSVSTYIHENNVLASEMVSKYSPNNKSPELPVNVIKGTSIENKVIENKVIENKVIENKVIENKVIEDTVIEDTLIEDTVIEDEDEKVTENRFETISFNFPHTSDKPTNDFNLTNENKPIVTDNLTIERNLTVPNFISNSRRGSRETVDSSGKPIIKFCFTPIKSPKLVEGDAYFPLQHLDSIELQDMYHGLEESQHFTITRSLSLDDISSTTADQDQTNVHNYDYKNYENSDTISQGSMESYHESFQCSNSNEVLNGSTKLKGAKRQKSYSLSHTDTVDDDYNDNDDDDDEDDNVNADSLDVVNQSKSIKRNSTASDV